jgi:hypothetical protein
MRQANPWRDYGSVTWWREGKGVRARFRGRWSDTVAYFPTLSAFRRAAYHQLKNGTASETTADGYRLWELAETN